MIGSHNSDIKVAFYNDRVKEVIAADLIAEPFTYVPITAGHMELVGGNAIAFGKITEGYDVTGIEVSTELTYEDVSGEQSSTVLSVSFIQTSAVGGYTGIPEYDNAVEYHVGDKVVYSFSGTKYYYRCLATTIGNAPSPYGTTDYWINLSVGAIPTFRKITGDISIKIPDIIVVGSTFNVSVINEEEGIAYMLASYIVLLGDTCADVKTGLELDMTAKGFEVVATTTPCEIRLYTRYAYFENTPQYEIGDISTVFTPFTINAYVSNYGLTAVFPQLKCGAVHAYGIVYKDRANRTCSIIKDGALSVYIPFYSEDADNGLSSIAKLVFKISHKPPVDKDGICWAETYEIVYFGNVSMDYFLQIRESDIVSLDNNRYSINIQETLDSTRNNNNRWKVADYSWEAGDRMRLVETINEATGYGEAIGADLIYDYEIEATGTEYNEEAIGGKWLIVQAVDHPDVFEDATNIIVEVYRPRKGISETVAYGTGMVFEIGTDANGNKYHKGDVDQVFDTDRVCTTPAEVNNTANDCWKFFRLNYKKGTEDIQPFWAESIFPSDWWAGQIMSNKLTSMGFPFLNDLSQRQTILDERIRHGGFIITGTRTNNIAHFTYDDFMDLPKKNGDIVGLREVGFTLKVIQLYKETSIYINRIQTFNPDGTEQFTLTDKFFAEQRPMETDYGCQHPDSIILNGRNLYYWDNSQGVFIRSAPNGQKVLDIKMKRWFKDTLRWIRTSGGGDLLETRTGANNDHDEVWLTFRMGTEVRGVIFSEKQGRFISRLNQETESYLHLGNFFAHLYHQRLWIMNIDEGQDYLSWSGSPVYAEFEVVSNIEPIKNKVFNAIAVFADHLLQSLSKYVYIPEEASGTNDLMQTNIPIFDRREGVYYGKILRDENSPGTFASVIASKMNGRVMRGRYCFFKFKTEEHDEKVRVDSIVIMSTLSERNV